MTRVVNIKHGEKYDVYCGRPGKGESGYFGNPHVVGFCQICNVEHRRGEAIEAFKPYFYDRIKNDSNFLSKVLALKDKTLGCFCKPLACHCDIIVDYLDNQLDTLPKNRVIIAGSRHLYNYSVVIDAIRESGFEINEVVCGCAKGPDTNGRIWAEKNNIPVKKFPAKWDDFTVKPCVIKTRYDGAKYNSWAGHIRNKEMAEYGTHLILIWDGKSSGSASMKKLAKERGLTIYEKIVT
jgi:hypothetical protein